MPEVRQGEQSRRREVGVGQGALDRQAVRLVPRSTPGGDHRGGGTAWGAASHQGAKKVTRAAIAAHEDCAEPAPGVSFDAT